MKQLLALILALLAWPGPWLYAEDFTPPAGATVAVTTPIGELEPFQWPVSNLIGGKRVKIVSKFGRRKALNVKTSTTTVPGPGVDELHEGVDFAVPPEANVRASRPGKVLFAGYSTAYVSRADKKDKNHLVIVRHADGKSTRYVHLERLKVRPGQELKAGEILGTTSASDEWTEPVLHFEIRESNGQALDPMIFLVDPQKPL